MRRKLVAYKPKHGVSTYASVPYVKTDYTITQPFSYYLVGIRTLNNNRLHKLYRKPVFSSNTVRQKHCYCLNLRTFLLFIILKEVHSMKLFVFARSYLRRKILNIYEHI